ncbi:DUF3416 domain-containing protein [Roseomonas sp. OT10]|uniref:maltotransferase domain-containing protein n=1 Tax=Roseomonas cutis TaxID=2897332 RepID=UPI001E5B0331|nr:maltotransferase domain-containing protein [Roseomonas sp. OT10]UFN47283.1 DUF3416 domain-containing protein [Roseomonas sp. OT10]
MTDAKPSVFPLYYLHPLLAGPLPAWEPELERIAALGFRGVAIPPAFRPGQAGELGRVADYDEPHPGLGVAGDGTAAVAAIAAACRRHGLSLVMDLSPDQVAADGAMAAAHPEWFRVAEAAYTDPRLSPEDRALALSQGFPDGLAAWWEARLRAWAEAGVAGFRALHPERLPPEAWRRLIAAAPGCAFLAWTPGLPLPAAAALGEAGFARLASSAAWWDFRAGWLMAEHGALATAAPLLAFPEAPFGPRLDAGEGDSGLRERAARRALRFAAAFGDGLLVPMGFEFGASAPLSPAAGSPEEWAALRRAAPYDLSDGLAEANALAAKLAPLAGGAMLPLTGPDAPVAAILRLEGGDPRTAGQGVVILANPALRVAGAVSPEALLPEAGGALGPFRMLGEAEAAPLRPGVPLLLEAGEVRLLAAGPATPIERPERMRPTPDEAVEAPRVAIEAVTPLVDGGRFPVKRIVGEAVLVEADVFTDGHGKLGVALLWRAADEPGWQQVRMAFLNNDRWAASFPLERQGRYEFAVEGWVDVFATYRDELQKKHAAGIDVTLELEEGRRLVAAAAERDAGELGSALAALAARLAEGDNAARVEALLAPTTATLMAEADDRPHRVRQESAGLVEAERTAARFASWYEIFPRSQSGDPGRHGTLDDVIAQLPRIRAMGFDVLYFPPIHPIGRKNRKGRNNTLTPGPEDVGSPYAIGSEDGGHDALHPALGTLDDFRRLREAAEAHGLELALDFAIQCSPDHPWLREHPEWFDWRPDGTIKYAENPPKKYEDIVNVDFYAEGAKPSLWVALRDAVLFWVEQGVKTFRVDNPHTKPLPFWEWMIGDIRAKHPDTLFLSEAFTRPKVMYRLAKVGFSQSYTYFTWRNTKAELRDYLVELNTTAPRDFFRPHFFVNTPDINPLFLHHSGRPGHLIRAALAATLSGLWGVYNGFELCEATPVKEGKEEYLDSEKYEIRAWDHDRPGNIIAEITRLNAIRRANPALHSHLGVAFHNAWNDNILYYAKANPDRSNVLLVAVSLDPFQPQEADYELPLWEWGLPDHGSLEVEDLMRGNRFTLTGKHQRLRLDPADLPFAIWRVRPAGA